jgi:hypothetical protein
MAWRWLPGSQRYAKWAGNATDVIGKTDPDFRCKMPIRQEAGVKYSHGPLLPARELWPAIDL